MNTTIKVLSTVQALGADCSVSNKYAYITGFDPMLVRGIVPTSVIAPVTEVLQVTTGTPVAADITSYSISLSFYNLKTNAQDTNVYTLADSGVGATATSICDYFRAAINADNTIVPIAATGTTTLVLTAVTGANSAQAQFSVTNGGNGTITFVTGTPAVCAVGKGIHLKGGQYYSEDLADSSYYYQAVMKYNNQSPTGSEMQTSALVNANVLYVLSTATNVETLVGTYGTVTQMLQGKSATYVAGTGTLAATAATDLLTLAGGGEFAAQGITTGDVLFQDGETTYYLVNNVLTLTTANAVVGTDNGAAAYTIIQIAN